MQELTQANDPATDWPRLGPAIDDALHSLDESHREAVLRRFFEGHAFAEIGRALQLSEEAARKRVERALEKMAAVLSRRGVTSTSAALAIALANQMGAAAPAGLAATVSSAALAGSVTAAGVGLATGLFGFMSATKTVVVTAGVLVAIVTGVSIYQYARARDAQARLALSRSEQAALRAQLANEAKVRRDAENRFTAAERDTGELLAAVEAAQARTNVALATEQAERPKLNQELIAHELDYRRASERRKQNEEYYGGKLEQAALRDTDRGFDILIAEAEERAAKGELQMALRFLSRALEIMPQGQSLSEHVVRLRTTLLAQREHAEVMLVSDGKTYVSIESVRPPSQLESVKEKIPPGNYRVIGRRMGYRDVVIPLQVRNGVPMPEVSVVCTELRRDPK